MLERKRDGREAGFRGSGSDGGVRRITHAVSDSGQTNTSGVADRAQWHVHRRGHYVRILWPVDGGASE